MKKTPSTNRLLQPMRPDHLVSVHSYRAEVAKEGYCWLDDAVPSETGIEQATEFDRQNRLRLHWGPPYMVACGHELPPRYYDVMEEVPDLFQRFMNLELNKESFLEFANKYGCIIWNGSVDTRSTKSMEVLRMPRANALTLGRWRHEVQQMLIADHLFTLAMRKDHFSLRDYMPEKPQAVVEPVGAQTFAVLIDGRTPRPSRGAIIEPLTAEGVFGRFKVQTDPVRERDEYIQIAFSAALSIVNERLYACHPSLLIDRDGTLCGYWTSRNLLGCIWLQYYLHLIGQLKLRLCSECGQAMNVTGRNRNCRKHARCSHNARQRRWRAKRKALTQRKRKLTKGLTQK